jgi:hypothetical protein
LVLSEVGESGDQKAAIDVRPGMAGCLSGMGAVVQLVFV